MTAPTSSEEVRFITEFLSAVHRNYGRPTIWERLVCWLFGHRPYKDSPRTRFSARIGICERCHHVPSAAP